MLKRILVAVICVPVVVALIWLGGIPFAAFTAVITALAAWELMHAIARLPLRMYVYTTAAAAVIPLGFWVGTSFGVKTLAFTALILMVLSFAEAIFVYGKEDTIPADHVIKCLFAGIVMPAMLSGLSIMNGYDSFSRCYVILAIGLAFITDTGAYFVGMFLGKHRGITQVSPNKSLEGFIGGMVFGALFAVVLGLVVSRVPFSAGNAAVNYFYLCIYGVFGALVTEVGDLAFSLIKREYGIKDYGKLLPGHGGMMDRFDSMVFCAPLVMLFSQCIPAFFI